MKVWIAIVAFLALLVMSARVSNELPLDLLFMSKVSGCAMVLISIPALIVLLSIHGLQALSMKVESAKTRRLRRQGLTDAQIEIELGKQPFLDRHPRVLGTGMIILLMFVFPPLAPAMLVMYIVRVIYAAQKAHEELEDEQTAIRTNGPDDPHSPAR